MSKGPIRLFGYARVSTEDEATDAQLHKRIDRTGVGTRPVRRHAALRPLPRNRPDPHCDLTRRPTLTPLP